MLLRRRLIADLLEALTEEKYPLGPDKLLQVEQLLGALPEDTPPEALRSLLAPLFSSNAQQQAHFYELFDQKLAQARAALEGEAEAPLNPIVQQARREENKLRRLLLFSLLLLAFAAGFLWEQSVWPSWLLPLGTLTGAVFAALKLIRRSPARYAYLAALLALIAAGQNLKIALSPPPPDPEPRETSYERFAAQQGNTETHQLSPDTAGLSHTAFKQDQQSGISNYGSKYAIDSSGLLTYTADSTAPAGSADTLCVLAHYLARSSDTIYVVVDILARPDDKPQADTGALAPINLPYPRELSELEVDPALQARAEWLRRYRWPAKGLLFALLLFAIWALLAWYERRRARFVAEIEQRDNPPYVWRIETGEEPRLFFEEELSLLLNRLRRREGANARRLNLPPTIRATVRQAGRASFVYRQQTRPPEYLLLIDSLDANDHRARLFDALYREMLGAEVLAERFFYQGDPRVCFNDQHPYGINLTELLHRHSEARLLLIGEGRRLLLPSGGQLAPWTRIFEGWRQRALLLTTPTEVWGRRERELGSLFPLAPAGIQGLDLALEQLETREQRPIADLLRRAAGAVSSPVTFEGSLLSTLRRYYPDERLIQWIAACALYPALHWDLTLYLGRCLPGAEANPPLVSAAHIRQLTRLPWFVEGRMPENARLQLLKYLSDQDLERPLRQALSQLMQRQAPQPPENSVAYDDYRMNVILNELLLQPDAGRRRELEQEFARYLEAGKTPDFVAFKLLERQATPLDLLAPPGWKKYLFRQGLARFGLRLWARLIPLSLLLALLIALIPLKTDVCGKGEMASWQGRDYCLQNGSDYLLYMQQWVADAISIQDHRRADSLRIAATAHARSAYSPSPDTLPFYRNIAAMYYNYGAGAYNCSRSAAPECEPLPADSLRAIACDNFSRGNTLYAAVSGSAGYEFYTAMQRACPANSDTAAQGSLVTPEAFAFSGQVLDAATGAPIAGAIVRAANANLIRNTQLQNPDTGPLLRAGGATAIADANGRYSLRIAANKLGPVLWVYIQADGYQALLTRARAADPLPSLRLEPENGPGDPDNAEETLWKNAIAGNTAEAYGVYLQQYPQGKYAAEARRRVEEAAWQQAVTANTPDAYRAYLQQYPQGKYAAEARSRLDTPPPPTIEGAPPRPDMVRIEGGTFEMGDVMGDNGNDWEKPVHRVSLSAFYLAPRELTFEEYDLFCQATKREKPEDRGWGRGNRPVIYVSWYDAVAYCNWLSEQHGYRKVYTINGETVSADWSADGYRLPTEAEWEYAARALGGKGGGKVRFGNGKDIADPKEINFDGRKVYKETYSIAGEYREKTTPAGSFAPNSLGLYDMSGNVWEWCWDWYDDYSSEAQNNPKGPDSGSGRVVRGGSWYYVPVFARCAFRYSYTPALSYNLLGFRLARAAR